VYVCERALLVVSPKRPSSHQGHSSSSPSRSTQLKQLARARARSHSKSKRTQNQSIKDQSEAHANQSIRSARTENVKSQNISLKIARVQMSNAPAVTKPRGSRMSSLVGSRSPVTPYCWSGSQPPVLQPSKRSNGATFGCLDGWSHWWRRSQIPEDTNADCHL